MSLHLKLKVGSCRANGNTIKAYFNENNTNIIIGGLRCKHAIWKDNSQQRFSGYPEMVSRRAHLSTSPITGMSDVHVHDIVCASMCITYIYQ